MTTTAMGSDVYAATITHATDPTGQGRVRLRIPQIAGDSITGWAYPTGTVTRQASVGERVWAAFDGGGTRLVWWTGQPSLIDASQVATNGLDGMAISDGIFGTADASVAHATLMQETLTNGSTTSSVGVLKLHAEGNDSYPGRICAFPASGTLQDRISITAPGRSTPSLTLNTDGSIVAAAPLQASGAAWTTVTSFNSGWAGTTTFTGGSPVASVKYRKDAEDNVWLYGALLINTTSAGSIPFVLPSGFYDPTENIGFWVTQKQASGAYVTGWAYISPAGNLHFDTSRGFTNNNGDSFFLNARAPLGNIA